jgi:hypothetical protein
MAQTISALIAHEMGWPCTLYLPDDPLEIMFFSPLGDGGEGLVVMEQINRVAPGAFDRLLRNWPEPHSDTKFAELVDECLRSSSKSPVGMSK